jgi:hypothetical protein
MQSPSNHSANSFCNASKYRLWRLSILVIWLFSGMGHIYADTSECPLYIDEKGNIGIGTQNPQSILSIMGKSLPDAKSIMGSTTGIM